MGREFENDGRPVEAGRKSWCWDRTREHARNRDGTPNEDQVPVPVLGAASGRGLSAASLHRRVRGGFMSSRLGTVLSLRRDHRTWARPHHCGRGRGRRERVR